MDGRLVRWQRTHRAIVAAALELVAESGDLPGAQAIADRAGVSKRTVFGHFPDLETLFSDAADHQQYTSWSLLTRPDPAMPFESRLASAIEQRARLFDEIGPVRRVAARYQKDYQALAELMDTSRQALRQHLANWLALELDGLEPPVAEGVHAVASFEVWEVLRYQQGLSFPNASATVQSTIRAVVAAELVKEA